MELTDSEFTPTVVQPLLEVSLSVVFEVLAVVVLVFLAVVRLLQSRLGLFDLPRLR